VVIGSVVLLSWYMYYVVIPDTIKRWAHIKPSQTI